MTFFEARKIAKICTYIVPQKKPDPKIELSAAKMQVFSAERQGFEPWVPHKSTTVFETAPFNHSGISPASI